MKHTAIAAALGLLSAGALAQPNIGNVLQQVPSTSPVERPAAPLPTVRGQEVRPPLRELPAGSPTITVREFKVVGAREISAATLAGLLAGEVGKPLNFAQLEDLAIRLTRHYRAAGYFVARVYLPEQEIADGVVTLQAVEGNYGRFILDNKSLVRDDIVQGMLDDVKKYDIVSLDTLERAMLIINDTPGAQVVRADVMPGQAVGTSDFAVGTVATPAHQGYVLADNHGTRATGRERVSANWEWNSPSGRGDRLTLTGLASFNGDLLNGRAGYSTVLSSSGWRGEVALGRTEYSLGDAFAALDAVGQATSLDVGATYPIRRVTDQTIQFGLSYAHKSLEDEVRSTSTVVPKRSDSLTASLSLRDEGALWGMDGVTSGSVALTSGRLNIRDAAARASDQAAGGADTHGTFSRLAAQISRTSVLSPDWRLATSFKLQRALGRNLDGSERMGIAGAGGVMAYPSGELSGSDAELLRVELSRNLAPAAGLKHQVSVLLNWGQARETDLSPKRDLSDVALGYVAQHRDGWLLKTYVAYRLGDAAVSEKSSRTRWVLQAGWVF